MAIDSAKKLKVCLSIIEHGTIWYEMRLNNQIIQNKNFETTLDLFDAIDLKIKVLLNDYNHSAVEIKKLTVNDKEVLPLFQHKASENTLWIRQGEWNFYITSPFYTWYHNASDQGWIA